MLKKLMTRIESRLHNWFGFPRVVLGDKRAQKKALLIYLPHVLNWKEGDARLHVHANARRCRYIAFSLVQRGYRVEVVHYDDVKFVPTEDYDVVIAASGQVLGRLRQTQKHGVWIYLRTGRHRNYIDRVMEDRYQQLNERKGTKLKWIKKKETPADFERFDAVACTDGNGSTSATYAAAGVTVFSFRVPASPAIQFVSKEYEKRRNGFMYLAGWLPVGKGLDWLLEIFARRPDLELYICGRIPEEFKALYFNELQLPNIHEMGFVEPTSQMFMELCQKAVWYISPSATEGCQGAALTTMAAGLIPILSEACGVDTLGVGLTITPCAMDVLVETIDRAAHFPVNTLEAQSRKARRVIEERYQEKHFEEDWEHILEQVGI